MTMAEEQAGDDNTGHDSVGHDRTVDTSQALCPIHTACQTQDSGGVN